MDMTIFQYRKILLFLHKAGTGNRQLFTAGGSGPEEPRDGWRGAQVAGGLNFFGLNPV